ncbi:hypothetical protein [Archaeoglobus profundus]|uniref:Uncharacterized protein n=1 Tax=Archaeoglobus profundus (strain DSM 5631 / JCM 9629 / NBRC 100127 / Av18) TaxID=572546 RepID=D2RHF5_ARCPA|nr:hypothetical protein [Archaeoglobus profundus]ADB57730.1 hypothetical protein Arcpr_0665 [Archaeoglobus profundus DSM 5631]
MSLAITNIVPNIVPALLGLVAIALSAVAHSSLSSEEIDARIISLKKLATAILLLFITFAYIGVTGFLIAFCGINPIYHSFYGPLLLLIVEAVILTQLLYALKSVGALRIGKEAFEFLIYLIVFHLALEDLHMHIGMYLTSTVARTIVISLVANTTLILLGLGGYLLKKCRDLMLLVDAIDVIPSLKTACFALALFGLYGIHRLFAHSTQSNCPLSVCATIAMIVSAIQLLYELDKKYLTPLKRYSRI